MHLVGLADHRGGNFDRGAQKIESRHVLTLNQNDDARTFVEKNNANWQLRRVVGAAMVAAKSAICETSSSTMSMFFNGAKHSMKALMRTAMRPQSSKKAVVV